MPHTCISCSSHPTPRPVSQSGQHELKRDRRTEVSGGWCHFILGSQLSWLIQSVSTVWRNSAHQGQSHRAIPRNTWICGKKWGHTWQGSSRGEGPRNAGTLFWTTCPEGTRSVFSISLGAMAKNSLVVNFLWNYDNCSEQWKSTDNPQITNPFFPSSPVRGRKDIFKDVLVEVGRGQILSLLCLPCPRFWFECSEIGLRMSLMTGQLKHFGAR